MDIVAQCWDGSRVWMELKTFPTNYGASGKPITQFRNGVVKDLKKLAAKRGKDPHAFVIMIAYPIPIVKEKAWTHRMAEINEASATKERLADLRVKLHKDAFAHIYFIRSR